MRFVLDANLSPRLASVLAGTGLDVRHVSDIGLLAASDDAIFDRAAEDGLTADSDFPMMLASRRATSPSVVLLRNTNGVLPADLGALIVANLPGVMDDLARGAIVSLSPTRLAVRALPIA